MVSNFKWRGLIMMLKATLNFEFLCYCKHNLALTSNFDYIPQSASAIIIQYILYLSFNVYSRGSSVKKMKNLYGN